MAVIHCQSWNALRSHVKILNNSLKLIIKLYVSLKCDYSSKCGFSSVNLYDKGFPSSTNECHMTYTYSPLRLSVVAVERRRRNYHLNLLHLSWVAQESREGNPIWMQSDIIIFWSNSMLSVLRNLRLPRSLRMWCAWEMYIGHPTIHQCTGWLGQVQITLIHTSQCLQSASLMSISDINGNFSTFVYWGRWLSFTSNYIIVGVGTLSDSAIDWSIHIPDNRLSGMEFRRLYSIRDGRQSEGRIN